MLTVEELAALVLRLRNAQKTYIAIGGYMSFCRAELLEREVDAAVAEILGPAATGPQPDRSQ